MKKLRDWIDLIYTVTGMVLLACIFTTYLYMFGDKKFNITITWIGYGIGITLFLLGKYLTLLYKSSGVRHCPTCGSYDIRLISSHKKPTVYFCECKKCLTRSKYSHFKRLAIVDWNFKR